MAKWVYMFSEGDMTMRNLLGGKGANLAEMTSIRSEERRVGKECRSRWSPYH